MSILARIVVTVLLAFSFACALCSCAATTQLLNVQYSGEKPLKALDLLPLQEQIDAAAFTAALLVGNDPNATFENHSFRVNFYPGPIHYDGQDWADITTADAVNVVLWSPTCLFDPRSALLHGFVHQMFGIQRGGDMDAQHVNARWQLVPALNQALAEHYCPDQYPPFMPSPTAGSLR